MDKPGRGAAGRLGRWFFWQAGGVVGVVFGPGRGSQRLIYHVLIYTRRRCRGVFAVWWWLIEDGPGRANRLLDVPAYTSIAAERSTGGNKDQVYGIRLRHCRRVAEVTGGGGRGSVEFRRPRERLSIPLPPPPTLRTCTLSLLYVYNIYIYICDGYILLLLFYGVLMNRQERWLRVSGVWTRGAGCDGALNIPQVRSLFYLYIYILYNLYNI